MNHSTHQGWSRFFLRIALLAAILRPILCFCGLAWTSTTTSRRCTRLLVHEQQQHQRPSTSLEDIQIRDSLYGEIGAVVDVIMDSFYATATSPWTHMYRLGETNRLQQGFPYADRHKHRMLVAVAKEIDGSTGVLEERIVGFCDCDLRTPNQSTYNWNPRPYISDLCVSPSIRRKGVANKLVRYCEDFCQQLGKTEVFIRVERTNEPAVTLYQNLGYVEAENHLDDSTKIFVLRKVLKEL